MFRKLASCPDSVGALVQTLRTIADPTRLRLLGVLQGGERNVSSLCEELELPQPTVSHHLGLLRNAELVTNRRSGKQVFYGLNDDVVSNLCELGGVKLNTAGFELHLMSKIKPGDTVVDDAPAAVVETAIEPVAEVE